MVRWIVILLLPCVANLLAVSSQTLAQESRFAPRRVIAVADIDGANLEVLAREPAKGLTYNGSPAWSPDSAQIVFDSITPDRDWSDNQLFTVTVAGGEKGRIRNLGYGTAPGYSPDGSQIVFTLNPGSPTGGEQGIWVMNADGTGREFLTNGWYGRWSPAGDRIAFTPGLMDSNIHFFDLRRGQVDDTIIPCDADARVRWTPKGTSLAYVTYANFRVAYSSPDLPQCLRIVELGSTDRQPDALFPPESIADVAYSMGMFDWSGDGKHLVMRLRVARSSAGIYTWEVGSQAEPKLILADTPTRRYSDPAWSPDGKRVAVAVAEFDAQPGKE